MAEGATGELIIGGVGLARYLDPAKDAEKYAPMPTLGWDRAYRSGDLVVNDPAGLLFGGRADDQVKLGGRRIELGEIDSALLSVPGVVSAAAAVRRTAAGNQLLVGYVASRRPATTRPRRSSSSGTRCPLRSSLGWRWWTCCPPGPSGKVDRDALPWPLPGADEAPEARGLHGTMAWLAQLWLELLGAGVTDPADDFFDLGGGSLSAAQLVSRLRDPLPRGGRRRRLRAPDRRHPRRPTSTGSTVAGPRLGPDHPADSAQDAGRAGGRDHRCCARWPGRTG